MKISRSLLILLIGFSSACDRRPQAEDREAERRREEVRQADERRVAELRDLEQRAAEREAAAQAVLNDVDRQKLAMERAEINREKAQLTAAQRRIEEQREAQARETERKADLRREEERLASERDARNVGFFYDALDPLGDWIEMEKYGYVWQPREAQNPRWRPYTDGNWAWTNYGWTWSSKEKFGWATYHYGRWARVKRIGWVWVPGSEWAPAWVSWRRSDQYIGWAPLPPDAHSGSGFTAAVDRNYDIGPGNYSFVPVETFGEPTYVGRVVEPERNVTIINQTVNVTKVTYRTVENKTAVFNAGPEINVIESRSRLPIRKLTVEKVAGQGPSTQKGNVLELSAPEIPANSKPVKPLKVRDHAKVSEVDNGWSPGGGDPQAIKKAHAKMTREADAAEPSGRPSLQTTPVDFQKPGSIAVPGEERRPERPGQRRRSETELQAERPSTVAPGKTPPVSTPPTSSQPGLPDATPAPGNPQKKPADTAEPPKATGRDSDRSKPGSIAVPGEERRPERPGQRRRSETELQAERPSTVAPGKTPPVSTPPTSSQPGLPDATPAPGNPQRKPAESPGKALERPANREADQGGGRGDGRQNSPPRRSLQEETITPPPDDERNPARRGVKRAVPENPASGQPTPPARSKASPPNAPAASENGLSQKAPTEP
ncbi:MAG: DUF6600 domain-containing protein [Verrucomicrobiota bacterium]